MSDPESPLAPLVLLSVTAAMLELSEAVVAVDLDCVATGRVVTEKFDEAGGDVLEEEGVVSGIDPFQINPTCETSVEDTIDWGVASASVGL